MILVATTTLGTACSIYSQFFTSSASQVGLAIVMREIYRYIYLFLFPTKLFPIVSPSSFKISFQIPRSLARIDRHFQFLSFLPPPLTNDSPTWRRAHSLVVSSSSHEGAGGGGEGKRFVRSNVLFGSSARCNNAERKTKNSRSPLHGGHLDPRTREEAVIALKWTWVAQGPPLSPWTRNNKFSTARR